MFICSSDEAEQSRSRPLDYKHEGQAQAFLHVLSQASVGALVYHVELAPYEQ
jgi:hypothetical protein